MYIVCFLCIKGVFQACSIYSGQTLPVLHYFHGILLQLRTKIEQIPKKLDEADRKIKELQQKYDNMQQLKPVKANVSPVKLGLT